MTLLLTARAQWVCREQPIPVGTPRPQGGLLDAGTIGENATVRGEASFLLTGLSWRPGPACAAAGDESWTAWVAWDGLALLQLNTTCFVMDAFGWVRKKRQALANRSHFFSAARSADAGPGIAVRAAVGAAGVPGGHAARRAGLHAGCLFCGLSLFRHDLRAARQVKRRQLGVAVTHRSTVFVIAATNPNTDTFASLT